MDEYYCAYEERYKKTYEAGAERWGHFSDDEELTEMLTRWVEKNSLKGKKVIEFACGEGASGVILSRLGCRYHGVDLAPSAIEKARAELRDYPNAAVEVLNMVTEKVGGAFDAALDVMGLHMLVTDGDRKSYLKNVYDALKPGAPALFNHESFRADEKEVQITTFDDWKKHSDSDYDKPEQRFVEHNGTKTEVWIPLVPARAKSKEGYLNEFSQIGFIVDDFVEMGESYKIRLSATIAMHKPK